MRVNPLWTLRVEGRERLPRHGAAVLVANHASLIDILVLFDLFRPYKWVSKASNFRLPFVGWNMRLNDYVPLRRGDRESVLEMLAHCGRHLERGSPILMFPEGTRSADGALKAFKDGAFDLAVAHGVPVIPIAVHGTAAALPKHGLVLEQHVDARIEVLEPIAPGTRPRGAARRGARAHRAGARRELTSRANLVRGRCVSSGHEDHQHRRRRGRRPGARRHSRARPRARPRAPRTPTASSARPSPRSTSPVSRARRSRSA